VAPLFPNQKGQDDDDDDDDEAYNAQDVIEDILEDGMVHFKEAGRGVWRKKLGFNYGELVNTKTEVSHHGVCVCVLK
jgi:hypothetical protein